MIRRRGIPDARPANRPDLKAAAWTALVLAAGFLALQTPPVITLFSWVAQALALCAEPLLELLGYDILRSGIELRDTLSGHAIAVTSACDGSGLLLSAAGALTWFSLRGARLRPWLEIAGLLVAGIFLFNLLRVLAIFLLIATPDVMQTVHLYVAPLLSAALIAGFVAHACRLDRQAAALLPGLWAAVAAASAIAWAFWGQAVTCLTVQPLANVLLTLVPDLLVSELRCVDAGALLVTSAAVSLQPPSVLNVPFYPTDFTLALPLVLASLACLRDVKQIVWGSVASLGLFALAMAIAALTLAQDQAVASGVSRLIGPNFSAPFVPMDGLLLALLKMLQNVVVHFNLFLLPLVLLGLDRARPQTGSKRPMRSRS